MLRLRAAGENSLMVYLGDSIDPAVNARVHAAIPALTSALGDELIDLIPSYASILVIYRPLSLSYRELTARIRSAILSAMEQLDIQNIESVTENTAGTQRYITLPVYYSPESGPDLELLAANAGLSIDEVIALHCAAQYRVYAIGFAPGFAYLGDVDPRIAAPRHATPHPSVPKGAVAIADRQTAVYPAQSPGGWNLIGRCPVALFDPDAVPPMPFAVGDCVQFEAVSREHYLSLGGELT